ncbi:hypothetical protein DFH29DRAFT_1041979 [Suillus ampliporus]|nr:hypothetical protein DFH29DRAFT_1041979 [Suillus ampliporus]
MAHGVGELAAVRPTYVPTGKGYRDSITTVQLGRLSSTSLAPASGNRTPCTTSVFVMTTRRHFTSCTFAFLPYTTSTIPGITGCSISANLSIPFILLFALELGVAGSRHIHRRTLTDTLFSLTFIRAIQRWRTANDPMYTHNMFYYACGIFFSAANVLTSRLLHFIMLAILALRMHLHLWQIDQQVHSSDDLVSSSALLEFELCKRQLMSGSRRRIEVAGIGLSDARNSNDSEHKAFGRIPPTPVHSIWITETEYLSDTDIAAATSLQTYTMDDSCTTSTYATYDYACSLQEEWTFLLGSRWTKVKGLYIITRFMPFVILATNLYLNFTPTENANKCQTLINIDLSFGLISATCSEAFFALRTYVLWNNNRFVLAAMLTGFLPKLVLDASVRVSSQDPLVLALRLMPPHHMQPARSRVSQVAQAVPTSTSRLFSCLRFNWSWRTANGPMYTVLIKHNIFYYACGLFFSAVNVLTSLLLEYQYHSMFQDLQLIILAILALRMHLHLWQIEEHTAHRVKLELCEVVIFGIRALQEECSASRLWVGAPTVSGGHNQHKHSPPSRLPLAIKMRSEQYQPKSQVPRQPPGRQMMESTTDH